MTTHLIQLMPDERKVLRWSTEHGFMATGDVGYGLHGMLHAAFGDMAPRVFTWLDSLGGFRKPHLLAYSPVSAQELREHAGFFGEAAALEALGVEGMASKVLPELRSGLRLGIEVVTRPVVRSGSTVDGRRRTVEHDAYIHARAKARDAGEDPALVDRDAIYRDWLEGRLAEQGVDVQTLQVVARRQVAVARRARPKGGNATSLRSVEGQEVRYDGIIEVVDPAAFAAALPNGIGRHRAFGYGMLVLRPAGALALAA